MNAIAFRLTLEQPMLATSLQGDPNSGVSFDYIPGSALRGALLARFLRAHHISASAALEHADCRRIFFSGQVRFLNAYLLSSDDIRSLPTPRVLSMQKHGDLDATPDLFNTSYHLWISAKRQEVELELRDRLVPLHAPFCVVGEQISVLRPKRRVAVHMQRNPRYGRALAGDGTVFQYDALAEGQAFGGAIIVDSEADLPMLMQLLEETNLCWLGRSRSAGYGKVRLDDIRHEPGWREIGAGAVPDLEPDSQHQIVFLSDTLLHADTGEYSTTLEDASLSRYLGFAVSIVDAHTHTASTTLGGFNRTWKMPLVQEYALAAGSVVSFTTSKAIDAARLADIEAQGIGDRRAEGFGRITFNWLTALRYTAAPADRTAPRSFSAASLPPAAEALARRMARQLLDADVDRAIATFVDAKLATAQRMPENSQLGRLRVIVRRALPRGDIALVREQFADFKAAAMSQFERARFDGTVFRTWIENLLDQYPNVLQKFERFERPSVATASAEPDTGRIALRLLAALLNALTREKEPAK
jgi:CRISPR-associated protein Csx10